MAERRDDAGFALEARERLGALDEVLGKHLHGDVTLQPCVAGAIDLAHAAGADRREELVRSEPRASSVRHPGRRDYRACRCPPAFAKATASLAEARLTSERAKADA